MPDALDRRCGTCARFVRVVESIDETGEVKRAGDCLLGVWPSPLYETSTCSQWVRRGEFRPQPQLRTRRPRLASFVASRTALRSGSRDQSSERPALSLPEDSTVHGCR